MAVKITVSVIKTFEVHSLSRKCRLSVRKFNTVRLSFYTIDSIETDPHCVNLMDFQSAFYEYRVYLKGSTPLSLFLRAH